MENNNKKLVRKTLAQFIQDTRESVGYSRQGLAKAANIDLQIIENIETGQDLFLSSVIRQRLARVLKLENAVIKIHEKEPNLTNSVSEEHLNALRQKIITGQTEDNLCPVCGSKLICRIAEMYDLDDKLIKHAKARCSKCPFLLR